MGGATAPHSGADPHFRVPIQGVTPKEIDAKSGLPGECGQAARAIDGAFPVESSEQVLIQGGRLRRVQCRPPS